MANKNLQAAKVAKKDEFYTQLTDIEKELRHYKEHFLGKTVICNCDDPRVSNFYKYFKMQFEHLGLKRLICTCYKHRDVDLFSDHNSEQAVYIDYVGAEENILPLKGDGDFRSQECVELLKQADIVVTNPPFSLFREYVAQLMKYGKKFLIIGPYNANHYSDIFPFIQNNELWHGFNTVKGFVTSDSTIQKFGNVIWYTNLDHTRRHEELILIRRYSEEEYPKYDNYDAINVNKVGDIPYDYNGIMGVPDTILDYYNPEQFEIIGLGCGELGKKIGVMKNYRGRSDLAYVVDGVNKCPYSRILIRRKQ